MAVLVELEHDVNAGRPQRGKQQQRRACGAGLAYLLHRQRGEEPRGQQAQGQRQARSARATLLLLAALGSSCVYVVLKLNEYGHLAGLGLGMEHNTFFTLYWILTGFHFLHVLLGMVILGWLAMRCRRGAYGPDNHSGLESGVLYWHMVDMVWVLLFPLVYVLR
jgi:heme/copper-type cytochrome/quinol oxidase subunit 3